MSAIWVDDLKQKLTWDLMRGAGNSALVKSSTAFPIVGYMILFSEEFNKFLKFNQKYNAFLSFDGRLQFIYFGLIFLSLFSFIYFFWCPKYVKLFDSEDHFAATLDNFTHDEVLHYMVLLEASGFIQEQSEIFRTLALRRLDNPNYGFAKTDALKTYFKYLNNKHWGARLSSFIFFILGLICLAVPSLDVFIRIVLRILGFSIQ